MMCYGGHSIIATISVEIDWLLFGRRLLWLIQIITWVEWCSTTLVSLKIFQGNSYNFWHLMLKKGKCLNPQSLYLKMVMVSTRLQL